MQSFPAKKPKYTVLYFANVKKWQAVKILSAEKTLINKSLKYHKEIYLAPVEAGKLLIAADGETYVYSQ